MMKNRLFLIAIIFLVASCTGTDDELRNYYSNGNLQSIEKISKNGKHNGESRFFLEKDGSLEVIANYKNDSLEGEFQAFYPSGKLKSISFWKDNKQNGNIVEYYENGQMKSSQFFKMGKPYGIGKFYYQNGEIHKERTFHLDTLVAFRDFDSTGLLIKKSISIRLAVESKDFKINKRNILKIIYEDRYLQRDSLVSFIRIRNASGQDVFTKKFHDERDTCVIEYLPESLGRFTVFAYVNEYNNKLSVFKNSDSIQVMVK